MDWEKEHKQFGYHPFYECRKEGKHFMVRRRNEDLEIVMVTNVTRVLVPFIALIARGPVFETVYADVWEEAELIGAQVVESCIEQPVRKMMPHQTPLVFAHHSDQKGVCFPSNVTVANVVKNEQFKFVVELTVGLLVLC